MIRFLRKPIVGKRLTCPNYGLELYLFYSYYFPSFEYFPGLFYNLKIFLFLVQNQNGNWTVEPMFMKKEKKVVKKLLYGLELYLFTPGQSITRHTFFGAILLLQ